MIIRYPGGKRKMRHEIVKRLLGVGDCQGLEYREPFFGGGGIGLAMLDNTVGINRIWINDVDPGIACLWTAVIRYPDELQRCVRRFRPSVDIFFDLKSELCANSVMPDQSGEIVRIGFNKLAVHRLSYSGLGTMSGGPLGGKWQASAYKIDSRWSPDSLCQMIEELHRKFAAITIRHDCCTNYDCARLIADDSCRSIMFLDPPYYRQGEKLYQYGFADGHARLADALSYTNHAWILSYDDCPEIRHLYQWAQIDSVPVRYSVARRKTGEASGRPGGLASELLISPRANRDGA